MEIKEVKYQVASLDEQETHISLDYLEKIVVIYSNRIYTVRKILAKGFKPTKIYHFNGQVEAAEWEVPFNQMGAFLRMGMFKVG